MPLSRFSAALASLVATVAIPATTRARARPLFEPTDLEMEDAGTVELDLQIGAVRGPGAWRAVLPDFELDVGLSPNLEIDVDGAYSIEGPTNGPFSFDHSAPDSLWPSFKLGIHDRRDELAGRGWTLGLQAGPKLPIASGASGVGIESLGLLGRSIRRVQVVLNLGGFVDPAPMRGSPRPIGIEGGLDLAVHLDNVDRVTLTGEIGGVGFLSADPNQLMATAGVSWSICGDFGVSVAALWGLLSGTDRYGLLLGLSPKLRAFGG
jgi:hypothetical protein